MMSSTPPLYPEIPIVDFGVFTGCSKLSDEAREKRKEHVARQIDEAFCHTGFVYVTNFGIEGSLVEEAFAWSKKFFDLPMETKMLAPHPPGGSHHRGYSAPGVEKVSQHVFDEGEIAKLREIPDYKESFESGNPLDTSQPNIWPPESILPDFQHFLETYFSHCSTLIHRLLDALTLALHLNYQHTLSEKGCGVSEEMEEVPDLSSTHANSLFQLRLLHYPPISAHDLTAHNRSRINAHSDFGTLTLLFQDTVGGLEVQTPNNQDTFTPAPPIPDTVLVNIGDLLARWSNDRWRSTVHRVVAPPPSSSAAGDKNVRRKERNGLDVAIPSRYSIPFFATADMDTVIEALPGCWDADAEQHGGRRKLYEPVTAWGYVQMRMKALYEG